MTEFRYSVCEPLNPKVIEKGMIAPDCVIGLFNDFQWGYYLKQIEVAETRKMDIYFSPSLEVENKANKNGLTISAVGDPEDPEFYICPCHGAMPYPRLGRWHGTQGSRP